MLYNLSWMFSEMGERVLAVDLDPQSNLSSMFLKRERMEEVVFEEDKQLTILDAIIPVSEGKDYKEVHLEPIGSNISLLIGNLALSAFEDKLSVAWMKCLSGDVYAFKVSSVFKTLMDDAAARSKADWVLIDVGPNLGAINRAVLIATDFVVMPVGADLFSLQGIKNLGKTLHDWRAQWAERVNKYPKSDKSANPAGKSLPIGYVLMQYTARDSRPVRSYIKWAEKIPAVYQSFVLGDKGPAAPESVQEDENRLAFLKHYHSLAPMSMEARKPIFLLKPADGAIGAHLQAVQRSYTDFNQLAEKIISVTNEHEVFKYESNSD